MPAHKTLAVKRKIAEDLRDGKTHQACIQIYGASKGCVSRIAGELDKWLKIDPEFLEKAPKRKKLEKVKTPGLDELVMGFIRQMVDNHCIITGPILQAAARSLAAQHLLLPGFNASNGWLESFRTRNAVVAKALAGESASAPVSIAEEYMSGLPEMLAPYEPHNVFNADEVGLYWEMTGRKTLIPVTGDAAGTKISKKRLTVLVVAAMDGHLEHMIIINSALHPRAFKDIHQDLSRLPSCIN